MEKEKDQGKKAMKPGGNWFWWVLGMAAIVIVVVLLVRQPADQQTVVDAPVATEAAATESPTAEPTEAPAAEPTEAPTAEPTEAPTAAPTEAPTAKPAATSAATSAPVVAAQAKAAAVTIAPTAAPTEAPTAAPTEAPTAAPTEAPTAAPTAAPTEAPTAAPTAAPTEAPTAAPTAAPTEAPTAAPTEAPTAEPTEAPTAALTEAPAAETAIAATAVPATGASVEPTTPAEPRKVTYSLDGNPEQLDPTLNSYSRSSTVLKQLFVGLYKVGPDGSTIVPAMAQSNTVSEDGLHYVFTLREGLKWSDGTPLTAKDFEYTWKRILNPDTASKAVASLYILKNGKEYNEGTAAAEDVGVKAIDDLTLEVDLAYPAPWFPALTANGSFVPVKQEAVESVAAWTDSAATYISNGPFMLKEYRPNDRIELVKNPHYIDADRVQLDAVDMVIIEDFTARQIAYENGEIDIADTLDAEAIGKYRDTPEYGVVYRIGLMYNDFNTTKPPFDNKLVRQAFAMSIDRQILVENVLISADIPVYGWVPQAQRSVTDPTKTYREVAGDMFAYDVEKAKALLVEAGYADMSTFPEVTLRVQADPQQTLLAQALQAMWQQNLGATVVIETSESSAYWSELDSGNFNIDRNGWTGDYEDPLANLIIYRTGSNAYENGWDNDEYDALIDTLQTETDPAKREALMIEAEKLLADEMPVSPVYSYGSPFLFKGRVHGLIKNTNGNVLLEYVSVDAQQ